MGGERTTSKKVWGLCVLTSTPKKESGNLAGEQSNGRDYGEETLYRGKIISRGRKGGGWVHFQDGGRLEGPYPLLDTLAFFVNIRKPQRFCLETFSPSFQMERGKERVVQEYGMMEGVAQTPTSWLDTSAWSLRVMPSPMADFIRRERDGRTLIGGYICKKEWKSNENTDTPHRGLGKLLRENILLFNK